MTQKSRLTGSGIPGAVANFIGGDVSSGLTATGSTQTDALALNDINEFTTVAASTGGRLPSAAPGDSILVYNIGASTLSVYPPTGESINAIAANGAFSVATTKTVLFVKVSNTRWVSLLTA